MCVCVCVHVCACVCVHVCVHVCVCVCVCTCMHKMCKSIFYRCIGNLVLICQDVLDSPTNLAVLGSLNNGCETNLHIKNTLKIDCCACLSTHSFWGFFVQLLAILDEGVATMSAIFEPRAIAEKIDLTRATLCTLKLLLSTLAKEEEFVTHLRQCSQSQSLVASSLTELLQGINPRTEKEDHLVNVTRFVVYKGYTHMRIKTCTHNCTHTHTHMNTYAHTHEHIRTHTHI